MMALTLADVWLRQRALRGRERWPSARGDATVFAVERRLHRAKRVFPLDLVWLAPRAAPSGACSSSLIGPVTIW